MRIEQFHALIFHPVSMAATNRRKILNLGTSIALFILTFGVLHYIVHKKFTARQQARLPPIDVRTRAIVERTFNRPRRKESLSESSEETVKELFSPLSSENWNFAMALMIDADILEPGHLLKTVQERKEVQLHNAERIYHLLKAYRASNPDSEFAADPQVEELMDQLESDDSGPGKFYRAVIGYGLTKDAREILIRESVLLQCEEALHDYYAPLESQLFPDKKQEPEIIQKAKLYVSANLGHPRALFEKGKRLLPDPTGVVEIAKAAAQGHKEAIEAMAKLCPMDIDAKADWMKLVC